MYQLWEKLLKFIINQQLINIWSLWALCLLHYEHVKLLLFSWMILYMYLTHTHTHTAKLAVACHFEGVTKCWHRLIKDVCHFIKRFVDVLTTHTHTLSLLFHSPILNWTYHGESWHSGFFFIMVIFRMLSLVT
jgi:hypothetical protein